jgi:hypothetical protein
MFSTDSSKRALPARMAARVTAMPAAMSPVQVPKFLLSSLIRALEGTPSAAEARVREFTRDTLNTAGSRSIVSLFMSSKTFPAAGV